MTDTPPVLRSTYGTPERPKIGLAEKLFSVIAALVGTVVGVAILVYACGPTLAVIPMVLFGAVVAGVAATES